MLHLIPVARVDLHLGLLLQPDRRAGRALHLRVRLDIELLWGRSVPLTTGELGERNRFSTFLWQFLLYLCLRFFRWRLLQFFVSFS